MLLYLGCHFFIQTSFGYRSTPRQNLSVSTYCMPSFSRNLVDSTTECAVICNPSWVCQDINIRPRALLENSPERLAMLSFQSLRYPRKSFSNQANLWSFTDVYRARNGFLFLWYSVVMRTLRQSKNESIISHNFAVAVASGEPNDLVTAASVALKHLGCQIHTYPREWIQPNMVIGYSWQQL